MIFLEKIKSKIIKAGKMLLYTSIAFLFLFFVLNLIFPVKTDVRYSTIVESSDGTMMKAFLSEDDKWRMMTELDEISPVLRKAIIYKEDKFFYYHFGVNPVAIFRAAFNNVFHARRTSGASTITMQVARLLQPKHRTYANKFVEIFRAMQLELKFSKDEILQLYVNLIPYGGNIEGIKAASYIYFQKPPQKLSLAEVTALTVIPNRPTSLTPGKNNVLLAQERNKWLFRFGEENLFSNEEIKDALNEPVEMYRHVLPSEAQHFCFRMKQQQKNVPIIKSTINRNMQLAVDEISRNASSKLKLMNINNIAVIVVNNKSHAVEAYVGSAGFENSEDGGQVDGVRAIRSPGSTLKPLLYATAFDKGLLTPKSRVLDVPLNVAGYFPENYDETFNGNVTVEFALINSLNIPACKTLDDVGIKPFVEKLKTAGFSTIALQEKQLGLSLILGGCGATLEQLTAMYSAFANSGRFSPVVMLQNEKPKNSAQVISPAAAYMVSDILSQMHRPDLPYNFQNTTHLPKVAWKTGTSYGRRDAWSIGYNKTYTVGVWVGNFSGKGVPELNGAEMATPVLFEVFNSIAYNSNNEWFLPPAAISYRLICSETGKLPDHFCSNRISDMYIPMISQNEKCTHEKPVFVSLDETVAYCTACMNDNVCKEKSYHFYQHELAAWMTAENIPFEKIPPHNTACERSFAEGQPVITSPVNGLEFYLDKHEEQQLQLSCNASIDVSKIYWFVNEKMIASVQPAEKVFFKPASGKNKITCTDDKGRSRTVSIDVKQL